MIDFSLENNELTVSLNGKCKATFSVGQVFFAVGTGKNDYSMSHGSFTIKQKIFSKKPLPVESIEKTVDGAMVKFSEGELRLSIEGDKVRFDPVGFSDYNRTWFSLPSDKDERLFGGGEVFSEFDLKGLKHDVWVAEHINARQTVVKLLNNAAGFRNNRFSQRYERYESYYAQPIYISSHIYFYHSLTTALSVFDFRKKDRVTVRTDEIAPFYLGYAEDYPALQKGLSDLVGRQPELPDWVYDGHILGIQGGTDVMMEKYQKVVDHGGKVAGIWIQDWEGRRVTALGKQLFWNWQWDETLYPDLPQKIRDLNACGVRVLGYCNPFLAIEKPLYKEAAEKGYCVKDKCGKDYLVKITTFPAAMVDLTNPDAYTWIKDVIKKNMIGLGLSGWMADFGEYLPTDAVLFSGEDAEAVHNTWPARWAKVNREAVEESGKLGEIFFFTRAGFSDTPRYTTMMWNGDNHPDFSIDFGLPSIIPAMLSLTTCGCGLSHSDVGGYTSLFNMRRNAEVFKRWFEMNTFCPLLRTHEGLNPDLNVQFDHNEDILSFGAKFSRIHAALKPYLKAAVKENAENGLGVVRPLFFHYDEPAAYDEKYEYLLGRDLLIAPVLRPRAKTRKVYLPDDEWVHLWSQKEYRGGVFTVPAPLGEIPVFIRKQAKDLLTILQKEL